jgi:hypothetical protein
MGHLLFIVWPLDDNKVPGHPPDALNCSPSRRQ